MGATGGVLQPDGESCFAADPGSVMLGAHQTRALVRPPLSRGCPGEDSPQTPPGPLRTLSHVNGLPGQAPWLCSLSQGDSPLPHEAQEHQQDQADEPPGGGKGLGHGEGAGAHDEVEHVHQSHLEATERTFSPETNSPLPPTAPGMTPGDGKTTEARRPDFRQGSG